MVKKKETSKKKDDKEILGEKTEKEKKQSKTTVNEAEKTEKKKKSAKTEEEAKKTKTERGNLLVPLGEYIKVAVHLGTRAVTPGMKQYVYRRKADGIAVLDTKKIDEKIKTAAAFLSQYEPEQILVCCKRDSGHKALDAFGKAIGARTFKRYSAGLITNPDLNNFFEPKVLFIIDPWLDRNPLKDSVKIKVPIVALCDTNNQVEYIDILVPCNNKTAMSIGLVLYIIAKLYFEKRKEKREINASDFYEVEERKEKPKKEKVNIKKMLAEKMRLGKS